ncbi:MAG TPA: DUF1508 domain-containing protein, partial [Saprospiraceae bacterium]|nr:DUF1508 domain-containing protein [Saprospiraceae bacterium]
MRIRLYQKTEDNLFYFQFLTKDDQLILDSQGYQSKDGRNNGVNSVKTNAAIAERYETHSEGGQYYFILKAANQQEIARSPMFASEEEMADAMNLLYTKAGGKDTPPAKTTGNDKTYAGKKGDDNYRPLAVYEQHTKNVENGFGTFADDDGHYYFAYNVGGKTILLSESYTSASGRNNGVESVTKNMVIADRYVRKVHPNGKHYFNLLAGNKQEIATSRWFDSEAEMEAAIASLMSGGTGATYVPREGYKADVPIDGPEETKDVPKEKKPRKKRAKSAKPKGEKVILKEGNYLFNDVTYHTMRSANEKYYFSFKSPEGKTVLLSANVRGYNTEEEVDAAVQRVMEFAPHEVNYEGKTTKNGKYYFYLNDRDGNRVAKSFFFNTTDEMQSAIGLFVGDLTVGDPTPAPKKEAKVDDYLPCGDYEGGVWFHTFFRGDREEYFFAFNSPDGKTYLRSEGYTTEKARDNGIESVKKNAPIEARWTTGTAMNDKYHYYALKAGNHQEIARSCYYSSKEEMEEAFSWVRGEQSILGEGAQYVD